MSTSTVREVNLHLSHSWGGGLGYWIEDFTRGSPSSRNIVLESVGEPHVFGIGHRLSDAAGKVLEAWTLPDPIAEVRPTHAAYRERLEQILERYNVQCVYVSSLIGHSLDIFGFDLPIVRVHHDFFPYCPALHCYLDGICTVCQREHLMECRERNPFFRPINSADYHIELRSKLLEAYRLPNVVHVAPSQVVANQYEVIDERFGDLEFHVIEHGIDLPRINLFGGAREGRRLRVGMLSYLQPTKGLEVVRRELERLRLVVDLVLLGTRDNTAEFAPRWAVEVVPTYDRVDLPNLLRRLELDLALFLSIVPETYSYTLSEVWSLGIPPLAHATGAFAERIQPGENGFLFRLEDDSLVEELLRLDRDREELRRVAGRLAGVRLRTAREMVGDYHALLAQSGLLAGCRESAPPRGHRRTNQP